MSDYTTRRCESRDVPFVANLERICFDPHWDRNRIREARASWHAAWWIVEDGCQPIAYAFWRAMPRSLDLVRLAVAPAYRRQGVATGILRRLQTRLATPRVTLRVCVPIDNLEMFRVALNAGMGEPRLLHADGPGTPATAVYVRWCQPAEVRRRSCR